MNIWDLLLALALVLSVVAAVLRIRSKRRRGLCGCGGCCCSACPHLSCSASLLHEKKQS